MATMKANNINKGKRAEKDGQRIHRSHRAGQTAGWYACEQRRRCRTPLHETCVYSFLKMFFNAFWLKYLAQTRHKRTRLGFSLRLAVTCVLFVPPAQSLAIRRPSDITNFYSQSLPCKLFYFFGWNAMRLLKRDVLYKFLTNRESQKR